MTRRSNAQTVSAPTTMPTTNTPTTCAIARECTGSRGAGGRVVHLLFRNGRSRAAFTERSFGRRGTATSSPYVCPDATRRRDRDEDASVRTAGGDRCRGPCVRGGGVQQHVQLEHRRRLDERRLSGGGAQRGRLDLCGAALPAVVPVVPPEGARRADQLSGDRVRWRDRAVHRADRRLRGDRHPAPE